MVVQNYKDRFEGIRSFNQIKVAFEEDKSPVNTTEDPYEKYSLHKSIGKGGEGKVYLARTKQGEERDYAMKITNKYDSAMGSRLKEHNLMLKINSSYILTAKEVYDFEGEYFVVSELMSGSLKKFFKVMCRKLCQESCDYMTFIIASAIQDLHNVNLIHRDLKSENILINEDGKILVADLGLASLLI